MSNVAASPTASPVTFMKVNPLCREILRTAILKKFLIMAKKYVQLKDEDRL